MADQETTNGTGIARGQMDFFAMLLLVTGVLVRIPGFFTNFWFDEIWSYHLVLGRALRSWDEMFTLHHSNNHYLNSLVLHFMGPNVHYALYRLPALIASFLALGLLYQHYRLRRSLPALCTVGFFALLFPHIYYASEARGYAFATLFTLAAWLVLAHEPKRMAWRWMMAYGVLLSLALLAHLTAVMAFPALTLYIYARKRGDQQPLLQWRPTVVALGYHLLPMVVLMALYLLDLRFTDLGTTVEYRQEVMQSSDFLPWLVLDRIPALLNNMLGIGWRGWFGLLTGGGLVILIGIWSFATCRKKQCSLAIFAVALLITPAALLVLKGEVRLFVRLLLINYVLLTVVFGAMAADGLSSTKPWHRWMTATLLCLILVANVYRLSRFYHAGRGAYEAAVARMVEAAADQEIIRVNGDFDFRHRMLVEFYAARVNGGTRLKYLDTEQALAGKPDWFIARHPKDTAFTFKGARYELDSTYPAYGYSGETWNLFRRRRAPTGN